MTRKAAVARILSAAAAIGTVAFAFAAPATARVPDDGQVPIDPAVVVPPPAAEETAQADAGIRESQLAAGALGGMALGGAAGAAFVAYRKRDRGALGPA